jgi:flagellar operon protein
MQAPRVEMKPQKLDGRSFGEVYQEKVDQQKEVKFSQHAINRMNMRGIEFNEQDMKKLSDAIDKMEEKGGKESLLMMGGTAYVVDVESRTIITAVNDMSGRDGVFTNIDSAMVVDSRAVL